MSLLLCVRVSALRLDTDTIFRVCVCVSTLARLCHRQEVLCEKIAKAFSAKPKIKQKGCYGELCIS